MIFMFKWINSIEIREKVNISKGIILNINFQNY
jgi:hypothetical protein